MATSHLVLVSFSICLTLVGQIQGAPKRDHALIYLTRFGYFDNGVNSEQLEDGSAFKNALAHFQSNSGLDITGELNDDTMRVMAQPRCGFKDTSGTGSDYRSRRYALQGSSWRRSNLKYKISKYPRRLSQMEVDQAVARAFSVWSKHADLTFTPSDAPDIDIKFEKYEHGDEDPFDGKGGILAHAIFPMNGGGVHFDGSEDWAVNSTDTDTKDLYKTAAHEIGHALGLGHSDVIQSLMAPFYNPMKSANLVTEDDVRAIQALYGRKPVPIRSNVFSELRESILCQDAKIDSIFSTKYGDVYVFKNDNYWQISPNGSILTGFPKKISSKWQNLPTPIDAAFTETTGKTYFFKGVKVWVYSENGLDVGYPKTIATTFSGIPNNVDAAFIWGGNGNIYFFKGSKFWKCDRLRKTCHLGNYPKSISQWNGIPSNVDAVFQSIDSNTYFFKGDSYFKFNNTEFAIFEDNPPYPRYTAKWWFGCKP